MIPMLFFAFTFVMNCAVSFLTGTAFGTAATMGAVCMTMANMMEYNPVIAGGAILAGVGVGIFSSVEDKCKNIALKNRYTPSGEDYEKAYEAYKKYDALLNVKG